MDFKYEPLGYEIVVPAAWEQTCPHTLRAVIMVLLNNTNFSTLDESTVGMFTMGVMTRLKLENNKLIFKIVKTMHDDE